MENINTTETSRERKRLVINDNEPFESVGDLKIITTNDLCKPINTLFKSTFKDYYGCVLRVQYQPDRGYIVIPSLVFQVLPPEQYENAVVAFKPITNGSNIVSRVSYVATKSTSGTTVEMTQDAKDIFSDFIIGQKIDWNSCYHNVRLNVNTYYIELSKLDIIKLVKMIYGEKDEFDSEYYYQITPTFKLNQNYKALDNWVLNILRLNYENEIKVANMLGMYVAPKSGINVITATTAE